jgi:hypothetical protein
MGALFAPLMAFAVSVISVAFMGILIHNNSASVLAVFTHNVVALADNATSIIEGYNATRECQSNLNATNYETCLSMGYMECATKSSQEVPISVTNLTTTRNTIQWECGNRTNQLTAEIVAASTASNVTIIQNGTLLVTVQGGAYTIPSTYTWKRLLIGDEFKLDLLILKNWTVAPIVSSTVNATITFDTFVPSLCIYQNQLPVPDSTYFSGANVTTFEGLCTSIVFNVVGSIGGSGVRLVTDFGIFF